MATVWVPVCITNQLAEKLWQGTGVERTELVGRPMNQSSMVNNTNHTPLDTNKDQI